MAPVGQSDAAVRGTQNSPLPPSVETAYYRKCIELKRRINEIEESNDAARLRKIRVNRQILKMRLERAFLLEQLQKRMDFNVDDSDRSTSPPPTPQEKPLRSKRGHRKTTPPPPGTGAAPIETPGSTAMPSTGAPGQGYFDAVAESQTSLPPPHLTPGQSHPSASPYPPIQPQPVHSSPSAPQTTLHLNGPSAGAPPGTSQAVYDVPEDEHHRDVQMQEREEGPIANGDAGPDTVPPQSGSPGPLPSSGPAGTGGGFTAVNR